MNKAFTVRRGLSLRETMAASQLMSRYIHHAVTEKKENIWIAQREGRAKDSSDHTQDAVLKMLAMGSSATSGLPADNLRDLNIVPLTISYEFDPCDYLKAQCVTPAPHLLIRGLTNCLTFPRLNGLRYWLSVWIARFIVATRFTHVTTSPSTSWKAPTPTSTTILKATKSASRNISLGSWQKFSYRTRTRLSSVSAC